MGVLISEPTFPRAGKIRCDAILRGFILIFGVPKAWRSHRCRKPRGGEGNLGFQDLPQKHPESQDFVETRFLLGFITEKIQNASSGAVLEAQETKNLAGETSPKRAKLSPKSSSWSSQSPHTPGDTELMEKSELNLAIKT